MKIELLGSGDELGIPVAGCSCDICKRAQHNLIFKRQPAAIKITTGISVTCIDTDLNQLNSVLDRSACDQLFLTNYCNEQIKGLDQFNLPISNGSKSNSQSLDKYWVAFNNTEIVGTVGILKIDNTSSLLKNMFVKKEYRGKDFTISHSLLKKACEWSEAEDLNQIYLGTMSQFKAAHKFYEKNGFKEIVRSKLPTSFIINPLDEIFYYKTFKR